MKNSEYTWINPKAIKEARVSLQEHKERYPEDKFPLASFLKGVPSNDMERFVRATRQLKWNVHKSLGGVYENGKLIWKTPYYRELSKINWHNLITNPTDLPSEDKEYLICYINKAKEKRYEICQYFSLYKDFLNPDKVIAWAIIPTFNE